jgi:uncharacterized membrane protein YfcA
MGFGISDRCRRGILLGPVGVGGATFTIPLFAFLSGLSQTEAQGTGLAVWQALQIGAAV